MAEIEEQQENALFAEENENHLENAVFAEDNENHREGENHEESALFAEDNENHQENESHQENEMLSDENEEENNSTRSSNEAFMLELNLVLILSYLSCSEEIIDLEEVKDTEFIKDQIAKHSASNPRKKARETSDFRAIGRLQTSRFQQKVMDCRHSRRM